MAHRSALALIGSLLLPASAVALPAFPGAEGFGSETGGGRGGRVLFVDNLDDAGPGSLRAAIDAPGCRMVLFRTGGTIVLSSPLEIREPCITIAGQSAPGEGIQIRNDPVGSGVGAGPDSFFSLVIDTHDVVIRYLRVRPGTILTNPDCVAAGEYDGLGSNTCRLATDIRAVSVEQNAFDVVLDHLSLAYAVDEMFNIAGAQDVTLSWSNVSEGLNYAVYDFGASSNAFYGKGVVVGAGVAVAEVEPAGRVSIHHNLIAHTTARLPQMGNHCLDPVSHDECFSDAVNNVAYNWLKFGVNVHNRLGHNYTNVVANFLRAGPDTSANVYDVSLRVTDWVDHPAAVTPFAEIEVYFGEPPLRNRRFVSDTQNEDMPLDCKTWDTQVDPPALEVCDPSAYSVPPHPTAPITTTPADDAWSQVPEEAGAIRTLDENGGWVLFRDTSDTRVLNDVRNGTGTIIASEAEWLARGYPDLDPGTPSLDTDADGMPDAWEQRYGLDPLTANAAADANGNGYTDLEEFLNGTVPVATQVPLLPGVGSAILVLALLGLGLFRGVKGAGGSWP